MWGRALLVLVLLSAVLIIGYELTNERLDIQSDTITKEAPDLGPGAHLLLPNLKDAVVVAPDRPHDPMELQNPQTREQITRLRQFLVSTNSQGFRSPEIDTPKKRTRILCLGDSVTFGWGVAQEESYPALLGKKLSVETINAGVPAMKPRHIAMWAKQLKYLEPDIILFARRPDWSNPNAFQSFQSSIQSIQKSFPQAKLGLILPPVSTFDPNGVQQAPRERAEIKRRLPNLPMIDLTPVFLNNMPSKGFKLNLQDGLQTMLSRKDGSVLAQGSAERGLATEIIQAFEADQSVQEPLFFDGGHPDAEGFILFSDQIAQWISKLGWL